MKLVAKEMAVPLMSEMIKNEDKKKKNESEEEIERKTEEEIKQDCEINAAKRLLPKFRKEYPKLPIRIIADSLYPSEELIKLSEKLKLEYIFVLKDKKIRTLTREFLDLASLPEAERKIRETKEEYVLTMWVNEIDYKGLKTNIIREIRKNKKMEKVQYGCG